MAMAPEGIRLLVRSGGPTETSETGVRAVVDRYNEKREGGG